MPKTVITVLFGLILSGQLAAGPGAWTGQGPHDGGSMTAVVADQAVPDRFYASGGTSLFRSDDGGMTWTPINTGLTEVSFNSRNLQAHPTLGGVVYASGRTSVWKTTDAGANWQLRITGLPAANTSLPLEDRETHQIHTVPSQPNTIYAATGSGLYVSTDAAGTWSATGFTSSTDLVAVDALDPNRIILQGIDPVTGEYRLYRSSDGGSSWSALEPLLPPGHTLGDPIRAIRFTDFSGTVIMLGNNGLYRSTDSGATWTLDTSFPPSSFHISIRVNPTDSDHLVIGYVFVESTDGGATWTTPTDRPRGLQDRVVRTRDMVFDPFNPNTRLAATQAGMYRQTGGGSWTRQSQGLDAYAIRALAVNPDNPDHVIVAGSERDENSPLVYRSTDAGNSWAESNAGLTAAILRALELDPNTAAAPLSTHVYASGWNLFPHTDSSGTPVSSDGGIYKSTDGGQSWSVIDNGLPVMPGTEFQENLATFRDIALRPDSGSSGGTGPLQTVFIVGSGMFGDDGTGAVERRSARIYKSTDAGGTWTASESGIPQPATPDGHYPAGVQLIIDPVDNDIMYFSSFLSGYGGSGTPTIDNGVFKSLDGGATWVHASNGLPRRDPGTPGSSHFNVLSLAQDPSASMTLYASINDTTEQETDLYKTTDGAATWSQLSGLPSDIGDIRDIRVDSSGTVYIANAQAFNSPGAIWASSDGGVTWNSMSAGLSPRSISTKLLIDESGTPARIYAGTDRSVQVFDVVDDADDDGVPDAVESAGPGGGDGNGDGTADSMQSNVASFQTGGPGRGAGSGYITVEVTALSGNCDVINDAVSPGPADLPVDAGYDYSHGLIRFDIADCEAADVRVIHHDAVSLDGAGIGFRNFGPEMPGSSNFVWYEFTDQVSVSGNEVGFSITDGGFGDIRAEDDRILFQGGVSVLAETFFADGFEVN